MAIPDPPGDGGAGPAADLDARIGRPQAPSYTRTLTNRPFLLLWLSQLISQSGDFIFEVALLWLVLELTHSAFDVGVMVTGTVLPGVVLGPFLGVYLDRWDRRRTLIATNLAEGVVVAALSGIVLAGKADVDLLFLIVLLLGTGARTVQIASNALVPVVVPTDDLPSANGLMSFSGSMNQIIGLSLGGVFVALLGVAVPIEYDAFTFFAAALLLIWITARPAPADAGPETAHFRREFAEGLAFVRQNAFLIQIILIGIVVNFFGYGIAALFAPYASFVLHGGAEVYGLLGAVVAVGTLVGAIALGRVDLHRSAGKYLLGGGICLGPVVAGLGLTHELPVALVLMLATGGTLAVTNVPISVAVQAKVPNRLLGRVGSTTGALISATGPAGPLFAGWLAERTSVPTVFLLSGLVIASVMAIGALTMRSLRSLEY